MVRNSDVNTVGRTGQPSSVSYLLAKESLARACLSLGLIWPALLNSPQEYQICSHLLGLHLSAPPNTKSVFKFLYLHMGQVHLLVDFWEN